MRWIVKALLVPRGQLVLLGLMELTELRVGIPTETGLMTLQKIST
jgi:hypothetical protein